MADWIASNVHYFPLLSVDETDVKNKKESTCTENGFKKSGKNHNFVGT